MDQPSALAAGAQPLAFCRFQLTLQRAEQNRACSRRGTNTMPHCSQFLVSAIEDILCGLRQPFA
jgi:hypothetical protein